MPQYRFHGFWPSAETDEGLFQLFTDLIGPAAIGYRFVYVVSVFAPPPRARRKDALYVQFSGESHFHDPSLFDINLIPSMPGPNIVPFPYMALEYWRRNHLRQRCFGRDLSEETFNAKKPCLFVVSNPNCRERMDFFHRLSEIMPVDSWGGVLNNQSGRRPTGKWWEQSYMDLIAQYRFMICFENSRKDFYMTEKLLNAYAGGTVPIYWGCPQVSEMINSDAFLAMQDDYGDRSASILAETVSALNSDYQLYRQAYSQALFSGDQEDPRFDLSAVSSELTKYRPLPNAQLQLA